MATNDSGSRAPHYFSRHIAISALLIFSAPLYAEPINYNSFTTNAAIGPPSEAFALKLAAITRATLGESGVVEFRKLPNGTTPPVGFGKGDASITRAVAAGVNAGGLDAAFVTGLHLNETWGFLYTSGVPFGPTFDEYIGFLYGKGTGNGSTTGLELLQSTLDRRGVNVIVVPIVGNSEQGSGYFPKPLADVRVQTCQGARHGGSGHCPADQRESQFVRGIGLSGLCGEHWKLRYVEPDLSIINQACDTLVKIGKIKQKNVDFIVPTPGQGVFAALVAGEIQGFEVATPLDDVSSLFAKPGVNPGTLGSRFIHFPGWHQQFLISYMIINRDLWNSWSNAQHDLIYAMGRENVLSSYAETINQQGQKLQEILLANRGDDDPRNDMVLSRWPEEDLRFLQAETISFLNERELSSSFPYDDVRDYSVLLEALRKYVSNNNAYWKIRGVTTSERFDGWHDAKGEPWKQILK